ncbi:MAG TPA: MFS transporter, partial [Acidimicrobiales bacterium]|nr:MFS transporter [Acidimicrobiales bacterium]
MRRVLRAVIADVGPLRRSADLRYLFAGQLVSMTGSMLTAVAIPYQVYEITRSSLLVGLVSLLQLVPILALGAFGGALADALDRRRMVRLTEAGLAVCSAVLVLNSALGRPRLAVVLAAAAVMAALDALQRPSLDALLPRVVDPADLDAATALSSVRSTVAMVAGPALAGVVIATAGVVTVYGLDVASFGFSLIMLWRMEAVPPPPDAGRVSLAGIAEGFRYARSRPDLTGTYAIDMAAMFFGMPEALFPQLATHLGGPAALGLLFTAPAAGALAVSVTSGWVPAVRRKGLVLIGAAAGWGAGIVVLGLAGRLWLALVALGFAGAMDMVSGLMRSTIWNSTIPDSLRGRLAGIEMLSYTSGPLLGNFEGGVAEAVGGLRFAVTSGGLACMAATAVIALAVPA